jgi:hypothetical protein
MHTLLEIRELARLRGGLIGCDDLIACGMSREGEGKSEETIARGGHEGEAKYLSHQDDVSSLVFSVVMMR